MADLQFVTVNKSDPKYKMLLNGESDDGRLVMPIPSLSLEKNANWATFELKDPVTTKVPPRGLVIVKGMRPRYLSMTLAAPLIVVADQLSRGVTPNWLFAASVMASLIFLHFSIFLFNDYKDHWQGVDLNTSRKAKGIIQLGWATAHEVKTWAYVNFVLGGLFAIPALMAQPKFVTLMGALVGLTFFVVSQIHSRLGEFGLTEFLVSVSLGPLLGFGFSQTVYGGSHAFALSLCIVFGWLSSLVFQSKYLEEMVSTYQNRRETLMGRLGFDVSKTFVQVQWVSMSLAFGALASSFHKWELVALVFPVWLGFAFFVFVPRLRHAPSPMSSSLWGLGHRTSMAHAILSGLTFLVLLVFP